jgi:hypothetical protein
MANNDAPFGLRPVRYKDGSPYQGQATAYFATGATGVIAPGDPVTLTGSANTAAFGGFDAGFLSQVSLATAGDTNSMVGVCVSVLAVTRESKTYRENSTDRIIMVADSPDLVFQVQADDDADSTDWSATETGLFANLASAAADTVNGRSKWELDGSDNPDSDYSNQVYLLQLAKIPGNVFGPFSVWEVLINLHEHTTGAINNAGRFEAI